MAGRVGALKERERRIRAIVPSRRRRRPRLPSLRVSVLVGVFALAVAGSAAYWLLLRSTAVEPRFSGTRSVAVIGAGSEAVPVAADGSIQRWLPAPGQGALPTLPPSAAPEKPRLAGTLLQQVRVLAAAPRPLRSHLRSSSYGGNGVDVELGSGIELRFGSAARARVKWKAASAVLADPEVTALDYVDVEAPGHPAVGGSGHALPAAP
jgi:hypothetical protein